MDLGIRGRKAIVCAASQGLGKGCALALAIEGVDVVINARGEDALQATAAEIRAASGVRVIAVPANRFGNPDEFGRACAFLCSADSGYIVGQNLLVDGGSVNSII